MSTFNGFLLGSIIVNLGSLSIPVDMQEPPTKYKSLMKAGSVASSSVASPFYFLLLFLKMSVNTRVIDYFDVIFASNRKAIKLEKKQPIGRRYNIVNR
jgi:hypothetical protein